MGDAPFGLFYVSPTEVYLEEPYKDRRRGNDPGQRFPFAIPRPGATGIWPQFQPIASSPGFKTDNVLPYAEHFNFSMQREISNSMILTLGYVGTRGHHLIAQTSFNPGNAARCLQIRQILGPDNGCGPGGQDQIYDLGSGQVAYGTRPFSVTSGRYLSDGLLDFSNNSYSTTVANSNYNALEVSLEKKVGALRLLGAYTWSKSLDDASGFADNINPFNRKVSKALSAFDMAHNFVVSYSYDLPFQRVSASGSGPVLKFLCRSPWVRAGITRSVAAGEWTGLIGMGSQFTSLTHERLTAISISPRTYFSRRTRTAIRSACPALPTVASSTDPD